MFRREVSVAECHLKVRVSEATADRVQIDASHHQPTGKRVSQIVKAKTEIDAAFNSGIDAV